MTETISGRKPDLLPIALKNHIRTSIETDGVFSADFDDQQLSKIVNPMIQNLLQSGGEEMKDIAFKGTEIDISNNTCSVIAKIKKGIDIKLGFDLGNSQTPGTIQGIKNSEGNFFTVSAGVMAGFVKNELGKPGKDGKPSAQESINEALADPTKSLLEVFQEEIESVKDIKVQIKGNKINFELLGDKKLIVETEKKTKKDVTGGEKPLAIQTQNIPDKVQKSTTIKKVKPKHIDNPVTAAKKQETPSNIPDGQSKNTNIKTNEVSPKIAPDLEKELSEAKESLDVALKNLNTGGLVERGILLRSVERMDNLLGEIRFQMNPGNNDFQKQEDYISENFARLLTMDPESKEAIRLHETIYSYITREYSDFVKAKRGTIELTDTEDKEYDIVFNELNLSNSKLIGNAINQASRETRIKDLKDLFEASVKRGRFVKGLLGKRLKSEEKTDLTPPWQYGI